MRVLKAVGKFSENVRIFTTDLVCVLHWLNCAWVPAEADKPPCTKPTVGVAFEIKSEVEPLIEIEAITGVAPAADPPLNAVALTRALVMRIVRDCPVVTGGRIGTPKNWIVLPLTMPWNTLAPELDVVPVQTPPLNVMQPSAAWPSRTLFVVVLVTPVFWPAQNEFAAGVPQPEAAGLVFGG